MRGDAVADAGRWRLAWHSPAHLERIVCVACHPRASAGTSRGHAGARWHSGTGACRSAAIRLGGSLSWATDHRNSSVAPRPPRAPVTHPYDSAIFARYRRVRVPLGAILGRLLRRGMRHRNGRLSRIGDSAPERDAIKGGRVVHGGCPCPPSAALPAQSACEIVWASRHEGLDHSPRRCCPQRHARHCR